MSGPPVDGNHRLGHWSCGETVDARQAARRMDCDHAAGLAGSFVAGYLGRLVGWYREGQSAGFIMSVLGAILLLFLHRVLMRQKTA